MHPRGLNSIHTLHRVLSARYSHPEKRFALWSYSVGPERNHKATQSSEKVSIVPITKVPLESTQLKNEGTALCVYVAGSLEATEGSQDESRTVWTFPGKTQVGNILTRLPGQAC